jgi:hypothetical protein
MIGAPRATAEQLEAAEGRRALIRTRWRLTFYPIAVLAGILAVFAPPAAVGALDYRNVVPILLFMGAIVVFFVGSWYDFGAKGYIRDMVRTHQAVTDGDVDRIHREQFIMTACYSGVAGLYVLVAILVYTL